MGCNLQGGAVSLLQVFSPLSIQHLPDFQQALFYGK